MLYYEAVGGWSENGWRFRFSFWGGGVICLGMERGAFIQLGLGPIGVEVVRHLVKAGYPIACAIDKNPAVVAKGLAEITGIGELQGTPIYATAEEALERHKEARLLVQTTVSNGALALEQLAPFARAGLAMVSTCEELVYPALTAGKEAGDFDALCKAHGARCAAAGINPGMLMDALPLYLRLAQKETTRVFAKRVVNASLRRQPLQQKIGSGMAPEDFRELFRQGKAGHAGFKQSVAILAHALGWRLERITETCEPVVAEREIKTDYFEVKRGQTRGLYQVAEGYCGGVAVIRLELTMALDEQDPHDSVTLSGQPPIEMRIAGGVHGDSATVATVANTLPRLQKMPAGLHLPTDLPVA